MIIKMTKIDTALSLFNQGFNCAQALLIAYGIELGLNRETALKIATPFGGGMGLMGETCGAVTGAFMVIGLKYGITTPDRNEKIKTYELIGRFVEEFKSSSAVHSIVCNELLGFDISSKKSHNHDTGDIINEKCPHYVKKAAEILEEIL
jgi:C_GCAxxG_C_C family probable redox protein